MPERTSPVLSRQFETDKTTCIGETQQAGLTGAAGMRGTPSGTLKTMRGNEAMDVIQECMARKGYVVVPRMETAQSPEPEQTAAVR